MFISKSNIKVCVFVYRMFSFASSIFDTVFLALLKISNPLHITSFDEQLRTAAHAQTNQPWNSFDHFEDWLII